MGLSERLARYAAIRPRPFVVGVPGGAQCRVIVDGESRPRYWFKVASPMASNLLIVCGDPGRGLTEAVDAVWADMPGPRAEVRLPSRASESAVREALDRAVAQLADFTAQRDDAASRIAAGPWQPGEEGNQGPHSGDDEHATHGEHDHGGGHEHHMMGAPGGLAMAERAPDRDGLKLDVLHVPVGPVLPDWPAGLRVMLTLQGDVVQAAGVDVLDGGGGGRFWDEPWLAATAGERVTRGVAERRRAAAHLDSLARFLGVVGWRDEAARARRLLDAVLTGWPRAELEPGFARFARRVGRSRSLRWMTRGLGVIDQAMVTRYGLTGPAGRRPGDVATRVAGWLGEVGASLAGLDDLAPLADDDGPRGPVGRAPGTATLAALPSLLEGVEFAAARLVVASVDPDIDQVVPAAENADA